VLGFKFSCHSIHAQGFVCEQYLKDTREVIFKSNPAEQPVSKSTFKDFPEGKKHTFTRLVSRLYHIATK